MMHNYKVVLGQSIRRRLAIGRSLVKDESAAVKIVS